VNASHFGVQVASSEDVAAAWTRFKGAGLKTLTEENRRRVPGFLSVTLAPPLRLLAVGSPVSAARSEGFS
jgi:hypothetical protein